jgi:ubiquinol-cytochrome c reductase cytochrome b subunit
VNDPSHVRYFGRDNDRMPSYGKEKSLTQREIEMVVDWIRQEWYVPTSVAARR